MVKNFFKKRGKNIICSVAALVLMWVFWVIAYYGVGNRLIVPSFGETAQSFFNYLGDAAFWTAVGNSLLRTLIAFLISFALAAAFAAFGLLGGWCKALVKPLTVVIRTLPTMAVILIIFKITNGNKTLSPVIVTVLVLFPMIYSQLTAAAEGIDGGIKEMAKVYGVSMRERLFKIYLPQISPSIFSQTGANISLGLKIMISSEVLVNTARGMGGMMQDNSLAGQVANLAALTLAAVVLGLIIELAFSQLSRINRKWYKGDGYGN